MHYLFRLACAMCFIGHGAFGIITKPIWCNYFAVFGIGEALAYQLMPLVGAMDILLGIMMIVYPLRIVAVWLIGWGLFTALLRPLSGEPFAEFLERAGNYGAPLVLLLASSTEASTKGLFKRMEPALTLDEDRWKLIVKSLQIAAFTLLLGHGWLNLIEKGGLLRQYTAIGFGNPVNAAHIIGLLEVLAALLILFKPLRQIVLILFAWKMISEVFYPAYGVLEWIERGGSYAVLLGLWFALERYQSKPVQAPA